MSFTIIMIVAMLLSIPIIAIIGNYALKLKAMQIDTDRSIIDELERMNRHLAQINHRLERIEQKEKMTKARLDAKSETDVLTREPLLKNQLQGEDVHPIPRTSAKEFRYE